MCARRMKNDLRCGQCKKVHKYEDHDPKRRLLFFANSLDSDPTAFCGPDCYESWMNEKCKGARNWAWPTKEADVDAWRQRQHERWTELFLH
jgi:hypothetical protein